MNPEESIGGSPFADREAEEFGEGSGIEREEE
jgi:hypothetical protein